MSPKEDRQPSIDTEKFQQFVGLLGLTEPPNEQLTEDFLRAFHAAVEKPFEAQWTIVSPSAVVYAFANVAFRVQEPRTEAFLRGLAWIVTGHEGGYVLDVPVEPENVLAYKIGAEQQYNKVPTDRRMYLG